jgi:hypothetical protein
MACNPNSLGMMTMDNPCSSGYSAFGLGDESGDDPKAVAYHTALSGWQRTWDQLIHQTGAFKNMPHAQWSALVEAHRKAKPQPPSVEATTQPTTDYTQLIAMMTATVGKSAADMYLGHLQYKMQMSAMRSGRAESSFPMGTTPTYMTTGTNDMVGKLGISKSTLLWLGLGFGGVVVLLAVLK